MIHCSFPRSAQGRLGFCLQALASAAVLLLLTSIAAGDERKDERETQSISVAKPTGDEGFPVPVARTDSPRATLSSFTRLSARLETAMAAYWEKRDREHAEHVVLIRDEFMSLIDLSHVPAATRDEVGGETGAYLLDIFGRIPLPDPKDVPDAAAFDDDGTAVYTIPETPFRIVRSEEAPRAGEFLFSARTIETAPRFYRGVAGRPLQTSLPIESWTTAIRQLSGPMIPVSLVRAIPDSLQQAAFGTPIWKLGLVALTTLLSALLLVAWHRVLAGRGGPARRLDGCWRQVLSAVSVIVVVLVLQSFFNYQVNVSGQFAKTVDHAATLLVYLGLAWIFWLLVVGSMEALIRRRAFREETLDSSMLLLLARIIGVAGTIIILAYGAQELGLPVFSILAGLGIGGLAIALAIRPTFENLIGGFILYLDKPIRVGDFCAFGERSGTVEKIGVRSIQIRALDRTLISVPNAQFADMQIINWAQCDQMLIAQTIGLRYETDADQLRYVLAKVREMFHGHPRIDSDTVRVRFAGYGASSLDVAIRVYAKTREWNDFFAIKEDVLFRIKDIVEQSGTGFAFPSQTLYLGKDSGLDAALGGKAKQEVSTWRRLRQLPFPRFPTSRLEQLDGRLQYPPPGSPDFNATEEELSDSGGERLSAELRPEEDAAVGGREGSPEERERK